MKKALAFFWASVVFGSLSIVLLSCSTSGGGGGVGAGGVVVHSEYFTVTSEEGSRHADILFVVDNSSSMVEEIASVKSRVEEFINVLTSQNITFKIWITLTDPAFHGKFLATNGGATSVSSTDSNPAALIHEMLDGMPFPGSGDEAGLASAYAAAQIVGTSNALSIIILADANDKSAQHWTYYVDGFKALEASLSTRTAFFPVVTPLDGSCLSGESIGYKYNSFVLNFLTEGSKLYDICKIEADFATISSSISNLSACFVLSSPATTLLQITLNGTAVSSANYTFSQLSNTICLGTGIELNTGSEVYVQYQ